MVNLEDLAISQLNDLNLPHSILIIPDGNGRWAKSQNLGTSEGHKTGGIKLMEVLKQFLKLKTKVIGIWGFSEDNWKRDKEEIDGIMGVIKNTIEDNMNTFMENNVRFIRLGKEERLRNEYPEVFETLRKAEEDTKGNDGKILAVFLDYGERFQLEEFAREREKDKETPTYDLLSKINKGLPLFDMVLRTSGELRTSGFGPLATLAEYVIIEKNLPEIGKNDFAQALIEYSQRQRRFGGRNLSK